jgi:hypothetical protein
VRVQPEPGIRPCDQEHCGNAPRKAEGSEGAQDQAAIVVRNEPGSQREHEGNVEDHDPVDDQDLQPVQGIDTLDTQSELSVDLQDQLGSDRKTLQITVTQQPCPSCYEPDCQHQREWPLEKPVGVVKDRAEGYGHGLDGECGDAGGQP